MGGISVIEISPTIPVKFGWSCIVAPPEAATQEFARKNLDLSVVYLPKVLRYIQKLAVEMNTDIYS